RRAGRPPSVDGWLLGPKARIDREWAREVRAPRRADARAARAARERGCHQEEMATTLDRSVSAVRYWMAEHALEGKARPGPRPLVSPEQIEAAIRNGAHTVSANCRRHGRTVFVIENSGRAKCR